MPAHPGWHRQYTAVILAIAVVGMAGCAGKKPPPAAAGGEERAGRGAEAVEPGLGAVSGLDDRDIHGIPVARVEELFEGRVPGAQVIRLPTGGISVRIRGRGTFGGDGEPLYVVDGMLVNPSPRGLDWLSPGDIRTIRVLKDASETSFYGVRGANGVVVITTKRGRKQE